MVLRYEMAQEADAEQIYTFCKDLIEQYETDPIDLDKVLLWCRKKITKRISEYHRILCDEEIAGYFHLCPPENGVVELDDFYLHGQFRRRGIGSAVMKEICFSADEQQQTLLLYVFKKNEGAMRLYERCGFVISEEAGSSRWIMTRDPK